MSQRPPPHADPFWPAGPYDSPGTNKGIELLEQIELTGSISRAAKNLQFSYKAAWDVINAMNNLSERPLVICTAGGEQGGTRLTEFGEETIRTWRRIQQEYRRYLAKVSRGVEHFAEIERLLKAITIKSSAGNQFHGRIRLIERGIIESCVTLELGGGLDIVATVSNDYADELQLATGRTAVALVKASFIILASDPEVVMSARNHLHGKVAAIIPGTISSEVKLQLPHGRILTASVTNESVLEMNLMPGQYCSAFIKASHVIVLA